MECPICGQKRPLVEHHIHGRAVPGAGSSWNKAYVCAGCHDEVHSGRIVVEGWVSTSKGKELAWRRAGESQDCLEGARPRLYGDGGSGGT